MNPFSIRSRRVHTFPCVLLLGAFSCISLASGCDNAPGGDDSSALVGVWTYTDEFGDLTEEMSFAADGTVTITDYSETPESVVVGTFSASGGVLTLEAELETGDPTMPTAPSRSVQHYVVDENRLGLTALLPDGSVDGVVGSWSGSADLSIGGVSFSDMTTEVTFAADGTVVVNVDGSSLFGPIVIEDAPGTYEELEPGVYQVEYDDGNASNSMTLQLIEGRGLSEHVYVRQ